MKWRAQRDWVAQAKSPLKHNTVTDELVNRALNTINHFNQGTGIFIQFDYELHGRSAHTKGCKNSDASRLYRHFLGIAANLCQIGFYLQPRNQFA
jgi:hypothetical protein